MASSKKIKRRIFWGVIYNFCVYCGIWTIRNEKDHACHVCAKDLPMEPKYDRLESWVTGVDINAELRGEFIIDDKELFEGCSASQIEALESRNVELLLEVG